MYLPRANAVAKNHVQRWMQAGFDWTVEPKLEPRRRGAFADSQSKGHHRNALVVGALAPAGHSTGVKERADPIEQPCFERDETGFSFGKRAREAECGELEVLMLAAELYREE